MPRVAMYIWRFDPVIGGAEQQCRLLSEELLKKGLGVFIVTERLKGTKGFEHRYGIPIYRVSGMAWARQLPGSIKHCFRFFKKEKTSESLFSDNKFGMPRGFLSFFTYTLPNYCFFLSSLKLFFNKRNDYDIIHVHEAHWIASFAVTIAKLFKKKVVVKEAIAGDIMTINMQSSCGQKKAMQADAFIAISGKIYSDLVSTGVSKEKIKKIPNGVIVDSERWKPDSNKEKKVICVTKINRLPNKGLDVLLKALGALLHQRGRKVDLRICGNGDADFWVKLACELGVRDSVSFIGFVGDVRPYLLSSYLFVIPSREEGMSNALLEAMSLGMPCVATDISGNQDLIQHKVNGLLVSKDNPEALADAIIYMLDNPDKALVMGDEARKTIEKSYAIPMVSDKYIELYKELVSKG